ncbi:AIG1-like protein [Tanacetum coccineum]
MISLPSCISDAAKHFEKHNQLIKLMQFLIGLDDACLPIRSIILTRDLVPSVKTTFVVVSREDTYQSIALMGTSPKPSATAFCTNCNKPGHSVERRYDIIVYPSGYVKKYNDIQEETNRAPFDLSEAEAESITGYNVEYARDAILNSSLLAEANNDKIEPRRWHNSTQQQAEAFQAQFETLRAELQAVSGNFKGDQEVTVIKMTRNGLITTCAKFVESVKNRFGPSKYEDPNEALLELLQLARVISIKTHYPWRRVFVGTNYRGSFRSPSSSVDWMEANKVVNDGDDSESSRPVKPTSNSESSCEVNVFKWVRQAIYIESTSDNDARDQASKLETKMIVEGKQDEAKVVVMADEQNSDEPDVLEGNGVISNQNNKGVDKEVQYSVYTLHVLILFLKHLNDKYIRKNMKSVMQRRLWDPGIRRIFKISP